MIGARAVTRYAGALTAERPFPWPSRSDHSAKYMTAKARRGTGEGREASPRRPVVTCETTLTGVMRVEPCTSREDTQGDSEKV